MTLGGSEDKEEGTDGSRKPVLPGGRGRGAEKCHLPSWDSPKRSISGTASMSAHLDRDVGRWAPCSHAARKDQQNGTEEITMCPSPDTGPGYEYRVHSKRTTKTQSCHKIQTSMKWFDGSSKRSTQNYRMTQQVFP